MDSNDINQAPHFLIQLWLLFGYNIARMKYQIILSREAVEDFKDLDAYTRAQIKDAIELHLRYEPTKTSRARIKRLRSMEHPQFRLRVGDDSRVFYDVVGTQVEILAIITKEEALQWLKQKK